MNLKRALIFALLAWVSIFLIWFVLMFIPVVKDIVMLQYVIYWILLIPLVLFLAKWYFRVDPPTVKKGLLLGVFSLVIMFVLDRVITVPFFIAPQQGGLQAAMTHYYSQWEIWFGFGWFLLLLAYAGWEFDKTFTSLTK